MTTRRHNWPHEGEDNYRRLDASACPDGNARTERTCSACSLVKITVHPVHGFPFREWRTRDGKLWRGDATPPCLPVEVAA